MTTRVFVAPETQPRPHKAGAVLRQEPTMVTVEQFIRIIIGILLIVLLVFLILHFA
jgi:hypothetical protein